jgi:hypothetical protein
MKFRSLHKWEIGESLHGLLFFAQRLDELLFDYSLDTYKPAALNAPYLCGEALSLIKDIDDGLVDEANLVHVLDELVWAIRSDKVAKSLLDVELEQYVLNTDKATLHQKRLRLEVLQKTLEPNRYLEKCHTLLREEVISCSKKGIDGLARSLATTLVNIGVSKAFLYSKTQEYFFRGDTPRITNPNQIDEFLELITPTYHDFDVFFVVSKQVREVSTSIKAFKISILDTLPEEVAEYANARGFTKTDNEAFVQVTEIRSFDCSSAREEADRRLDTLKDLFTLFYHKNQITWREETLIRQCCLDAPMILGHPKSAMEKAFDMNPQRASKQLNWLIRNLALKFGGSFKRFNRIVDLHGMCVTNDVSENQLLNLWISLETLVPSQVGKNKIHNIITSIDPFVRISYVTRLIDRVVHDLTLWNASIAKRILRKVPDSKGIGIHLKVLRLLALETNENLRKELYTELRDYHLLRFRIFDLSEKLRSPADIKDLLDSHSMKVAWQLRRIYRTRNLIVHSGRTPKYIGTLIENGHDYLDLILNEIMNLSCGSYHVETLEQAFELEKLLAQRYEKLLSDADSFNMDNVNFVYQQRANAYTEGKGSAAVDEVE